MESGLFVVKTKLHSQQKWQSIVSADPHHQSNVI